MTVAAPRRFGSILQAALRAETADVRLDEPLAPRITVRVGGPAETWLRPRSLAGLELALKLVRAEGQGLTLIGGGANTLVGDGGVPGLTVSLPTDLLPEEIEKDEAGARLTLSAGSAINRLTVVMRKHGLAGAEFLAGIPGTLGGAVAMNAGTKMGECMSIVEAVEVATAEGVGWLSLAQLPHRYRHTELPAGGVVTRVRFHLPFGDPAESQARMDADLGYRKRTQPLSLPNFGSVFKNPDGDHAGRLIEAAGLKGHTVGKAQVSQLHANWIVNLGGATAKDITTLISDAQRRVEEMSGIQLQPEVKRVGTFT